MGGRGEKSKEKSEKEKTNGEEREVTMKVEWRGEGDEAARGDGGGGDN